MLNLLSCMRNHVSRCADMNRDALSSESWCELLVAASLGMARASQLLVSPPRVPPGESLPQQEAQLLLPQPTMMFLRSPTPTVMRTWTSSGNSRSPILLIAPLRILGIVASVIGSMAGVIQLKFSFGHLLDRCRLMVGGGEAR